MYVIIFANGESVWLCKRLYLWASDPQEYVSEPGMPFGGNTMKGLMFAVAALAAGVTIADVTSANVVG